MVRDFTEATEEELLRLIGDKIDICTAGGIDYYNMFYNTESLDSDYSVYFQEINQHIASINGSTNLYLEYNQGQKAFVEKVFLDARTKDEEWAEEIAADIPEIMDNYLGNLNTLIESISCKTVGTVSQDGLSLSKHSRLIFAESQYQKCLYDVKSLVQLCYESLRGHNNEVDYDKVYELLAMDACDIELWQLQALCMLVDSYIEIHEESEDGITYSLNYDELEKFLNGGFEIVPDSVHMRGNVYVNCRTTDVFKMVVNAYNVRTMPLFLGDQNSAGYWDKPDGTKSYKESISYLNGVLAGVTKFYEDKIEIQYDGQDRVVLNFDIAAATQERNISICVQDGGVNKITIYAYQQLSNASENSEQDCAMNNIKDEDTVYVNQLKKGTMEGILGNMTDKLLPDGSHLGLAFDAAELLAGAGKAYDEVVEENNRNYRVYDNSVYRQICAGTGCYGTLISYDDEHLICNQHFDQKQLAIDVEYYNATVANYNDVHPDNPFPQITVEGVIQDVLGYGEDSGGYNSAKILSDFNNGDVTNIAFILPELEHYKPVANQTYKDLVSDRCEDARSISVSELGNICKEVLGGY